jgi:hypothetical protein
MWPREHYSWGAYDSVDGQRIDANNFKVDGISANPGGFHHNARPTDGQGHRLRFRPGAWFTSPLP